MSDTQSQVHELMKTLHSLRRSMHRLHLAHECPEMSMLQMHTLLEIHEHGSRSMKELATSQKIMPATMTALVDRLEKKGMLERIPDREDRRSIRVSLSKMGKDLLESFYKEQIVRASMLLNVLDAAEQETLVGLMKKIDGHFLTLIDKKQ